jgi:hypothetical protein
MSWASNAVASTRQLVMRQAGAMILSGLLAWPAIANGGASPRGSTVLRGGGLVGVLANQILSVDADLSAPGDETRAEPTLESFGDVPTRGFASHESMPRGHKRIMQVAFLMRSHLGRGPPVQLFNIGLRRQEVGFGSSARGTVDEYLGALSIRSDPVEIGASIFRIASPLPPSFFLKAGLLTLLNRSDLAEVQLAVPGLNWQSNTAAFICALSSNTNTAGLFTEKQLEGLVVDSPWIAPDYVCGLFKPQTSSNAAGQVKFQSASPQRDGVLPVDSPAVNVHALPRARS